MYVIIITTYVLHIGSSQTLPSSGGEAGEASDSGEAGGGPREDEVDLRSHRPAGGPILFQLIEMPPQPKSINNWTIRKG